MSEKRFGEFACVGCTRESPQIEVCRIYQYRFKVYGRKCPRQKDSPELGVEPQPPAALRLDIDVVTPQKVSEVPTTRPVPTNVNEDILTTNIRIEQIELGVFSPRKQFSATYIKELAESINREGQLKPIIVRLDPNNSNRYQLIDGEHRVRAIKHLKKHVVRAEIRVLSDEEADLLSLRVNEMHGMRLNRLEEGLHLQKLMEKYGWSQEEVGKVFNRSQDWVSERILVVRNASPELIQSFTTRVVSFSKAREIAELPKEVQPKVIEKVVEGRLSARNTETLVHALKDAPTLEQKQMILSKPIDVLSTMVTSPEELKRVLEEAPAEPVGQQFVCEECGAIYWIDWLSHQVRRCQRRVANPNEPQ